MGGDRAGQALVDGGQRLGQRLVRGTLEQGTELDQLEVAHDRVRDVQVGVEAQLAQRLAHARHVAQQVVAQGPEGGVHGFRGAEELLVAVLPCAVQRGASVLDEGRGRLGGAALGVLREGQHHALAPAGHGHVQQAAHPRLVGGAVVGGQVRGQQLVGDRLDGGVAGAGHPRGVQPEDEHVIELERGRGVHRRQAHPARAGARLRRGAGLLLAQPGVADGGQVAGELARRGLGGAAHVGGGQLGQAGEVDQALHDVGVRGEQLLAAQTEALDEAVDEQVRASRVQRRGGRAVQLEEGQDALARLGGQLGRLGGRQQRTDHVELAPPRDLHAARQVHRAQLDRRAGQRAHRRAGVGGVGQQAQPGQHVAHLGAREEVGRSDEVHRHAALLEGQAHGLALAAQRAHEHADALGWGARAHQALDLPGHRLRLGALVGTAPEAHPARARALEGQAQAWACGGDHGDGGARDGGGAAVGDLQHDLPHAGVGGAHVLDVARGRRAQAGGGRVVVGREPQVARPGPSGGARGQQRHQAHGRERQVLSVIDEEVAHARAHTRAHVPPVCQQRDGAQHQLTLVEHALLGGQTIVRGVQRRALTLARGARELFLVGLGQRAGPALHRARRDALGLEAVDALHHAGQQRGGVRGHVVAAQAQLVHALEQHGQAIAGPGGDGEGIQARLEGLAAQQPRAQPGRGVHRELLVGAFEALFDAATQRVGARHGGAQHHHGLGRHATGDQAGEALHERGGLARARRAQHQQRAAQMVDGPLLGGGQRQGHRQRIGAPHP